MEFSVQRLDSGDIALMHDLNRCFLDVFAEEANHEGVAPTASYLEELLRSRQNMAVVALIDGQIIGGLTAYEMRKFESQRSEIYIYDLAVYEVHRQQGVATALIDEVRAIARERNAWVVMVQADHGDDAPINLYSKLGQREEVLHFDINPMRHSAEQGSDV